MCLSDDDSDVHNNSFPGCNPDSDIEEDAGLKKRMKLLKWMEI